MKTILRFLFLLFLVCGTALAWKASDRRYRRFSPSAEASRAKEEGDSVSAAIQLLQPSSVNAEVLPAWSKADFQGKLEEAFQKSDPCAVLELLHNTADAAPKDYWSAGMAVLLSQARDRAPLLEELLASPDSPLYGTPKEGATGIEARFFNALIFSGQLRELGETADSPRRHGIRNIEKAIEIFKTLAQEDPENGAHSYFLATALRQSGAKKEEVHAAFSQASKAARFDAYYQALFDKLQTAAYSGSAAFTLAHAFLEAMPSPDYEQGIRYLKYWAHTEEPGKWVAHRLAKRWIDLGAKYKTNSPGYQYSRSEYLLGQNLKYTVEGRMEKSWEDYMNKMREAQNFISETPRSVQDAESVLYRERIENKRACGPDAWKSLYAAYKAKQGA